MPKSPSHEKIDVELLEATPEAETKTVLGVSSASASIESAPPEIIAEKYMVLEKLGAGGISSVYKVKHLHLDKTYALKLLHEVKQDSIKRFQQEAKAATRLHHPNIVGVVDFGISNGTPYMVMDCLEGPTLSQYLKQKAPVDSLKVTSFFGEICLALAHVHQNGVIHRDIKPSNIIITCEEGNEHAVVVDFGIAKIVNEHDGEGINNLTHTGDIFGTPLYMSPEQCQGFPVDARSDIYSLGCVMYELISGRPPFEGDSTFQIIHKHISSAPSPFSAELSRSKTNKQLEGIILKAMAKAPADRFQYMLELSSSLKAVELGSTQKEFVLQLRLAIARLKASDTQTFMFSLVMRVAILMSVILSVVLISFPTQIRTIESRIERQEQIVKRTKEVFTLNQDGDDSIFRIRKAIERERLIELNRLCKNEPQFIDEFKKMAHMVLASCDDLMDLKHAKRKLISDGLGLAGLNKIETQISLVMNSWSQACLEGVDFTNLVSNQTELLRKNLSFLNLTLILSAISAIPIEIVLAVLLFLSYQRRKNEKKQSSTAPRIDENTSN